MTNDAALGLTKVADNKQQSVEQSYHKSTVIEQDLIICENAEGKIKESTKNLYLYKKFKKCSEIKYHQIV